MESDNSNNYSYNKNLQPFANALRKQMTKAEVCLWKYALKSRQMKGYTFRRRRPVLKYIADFMCKELMLIIEVDGITHHFDNTAKNDELRTMDLENSGFAEMRFSDEEILKNMQGVIFTIEMKIEEFERLHPRPSGTPAGGG